MTAARDSSLSGYHHGQLADALLDATIELVRESGVDGLTMRAVAKRVGVSEAAPYHHFANKSELLAGAALLAFGALGEAIESSIRTNADDRRDPAIGLAVGYVTFGLTHPGEYGLIFGRHVTQLGLDKRAEVRSAGGATIVAATNAISASLTRRGSQALVSEVFPLVWALLHGVVDLVREHELGTDITVHDAVTMATRAIDALLNGLDA